jgi:hypothetical protein
MVNNHWHSVDAQSHDGAGSVSLSLLSVKTANTSYMTVYILLPPRLSKIHDQELLTICWCSLLWWGREIFTFSFANEGSQYYVYDSLQPVAPKVIPDTWPWMVDAPLTLIVMMRQGVFHILFCLWRQPILRCWLSATFRPPGYPRYVAKNCWRSIDAHFHDGAGSVSLFVLPIKAANTSFLARHNLSPCILSKIHYQQSWMLFWRSFYHGCIHNMQSFDLA